MKSAPGWGFLTTFDERILPHPREIGKNFYFLMKSPPIARTPLPPPPDGVYIDRCIIVPKGKEDPTRSVFVETNP